MPGPAIDYTITIGNIIEILSIVGGGVLVLMTLKTDVSALKSGARGLKADIAAMQAELKKLSDVLISLADIRGEIKVLDTRLTGAEQDIRELRHGDGFVQGRRGIDRQYPPGE
ncbi:hypothetical protein [Bradyrhizobium sp. SEMIA]|uniref:hypothetical protein n=1 Tax=Bradyrhizobium sp. SEMIA TaxID=2597515 RepID=UPI0018A3AADF|nr:hypothetical protein [Bradyrhizobium sp. SEMIA]QOG20476.1 hypothetical protein FOM02_27100 [Bradyrhizobium sp. SEMIA]